MITTTRILLATGILLISASAWAAPPAGTGNFRRAEVVQAAGLKTPYVMGVSTTARNSAEKNGGMNLPKDAHIMAVTDSKKVILVKAPLDKTQPVTRMTGPAIARAGLQDQKAAQKVAEREDGKVTAVKPAGLSGDGHGYNFEVANAKGPRVDDRSVPIRKGAVGASATESQK